MADTQPLHLSWPIRIIGRKFASSEQHTEEELRDCVSCILAYPFGYREDIPEFGLRSPEFTNPDPTEVVDAVHKWETRASVVVNKTIDVPNVTMEVKVSQNA